LRGGRGLGCALISTIWGKRGSRVVVQENGFWRNEIAGQNCFVPKLHDLVYVLRLLYLSFHRRDGTGRMSRLLEANRDRTSGYATGSQTRQRTRIQEAVIGVLE
jgi:hypothetical protein